MTKRANLENDLKNTRLYDYGVDTDTRTILLFDEKDGELDESMSYVFHCNMTILENLSDEPIFIKLNTGGGSITDGKAIIDRILASTCEIHIHAVGRICSMGIYILAAAEVRTSSALTSFMFHESSYDVEGKHSENKSYIKFSDIDEKHLNRWLATRTKKPADFWNKLGVGSDYWFLAEEAKTLGLVEEIV